MTIPGGRPLRRPRRPLTATAVAAVLALAACADTGDVDRVAPTDEPTSSSPSPEATPSAVASPSAPVAGPSASDGTATPSPAAPEEPDGLADDELRTLGVNELGRVLVGQWHRIGDSDGEYRTSRDTFRAQLDDLYARGFRPVTQAEFIAGTFPIPAGTSPVLLTFDDSTRDQFKLGDDGQPVPDTAVAILEEFAATHDDWRATAVFGFNFPEPFGDAGFADELRWLHANGYEFSNHTVGHVNLRSLSAAAVVENLASNQAQLQAVVPDASVPSLTLPLGIHADDPTVELTGSADGVTYSHELVYLVGSYPTRSPHHADFDGALVQRVPAHAVVGTGPEWWSQQLDWLDDEAMRFVSDGLPDTVTYPLEWADVADVDDTVHAVRTY